ncbi:Esterase E4 [Eufriesea mexicana]|nr:Esterase E4 [Eufriesea mexicana]
MTSENIVVRVKQGHLRGSIEQNDYGNEYMVFRGIPFAKPPVGPLRFKDPEPPEPWTGIRNALEFGNNCAQVDVITHQLIGSDDCLYLNVYSTAIEDEEKHAVMVWIHGGAFKHGSSKDDIYGPDYLMRKDIVLVTFNYRISILGFMNLECEIATGNQGLKDQVMALRWVQENISSFGGDPNNVTIFGESAGAASVHLLTLSPMSQGLFHKAIAQSGVAFNPWAIQTEEPKKFTYMLAAKLGMDSTDPQTVINFLRTIDAKKLVITELELTGEQKPYMMFGTFGPSIDDVSPNPFLPQHPRILMQKGINIPFLIVFREMGNDENLRYLNTNFDLVLPVEMIRSLQKDGISPSDVKRLYFGDKLICKKTLQEYVDYISDMMFLQGIYEVVKVQMENNCQSTYLYKFTYDATESLMRIFFNIALPRVTHAEELQYLFYAHLGKRIKIEPAKVGTEKFKIIDTVTQMWTDFAKTGNPTPKITDLIKTIWKPIEKSDSYNYLNINRTLRMESINVQEQKFDWKRIKNKL